jgi:hypothetical protein
MKNSYSLSYHICEDYFFHRTGPDSFIGLFPRHPWRLHHLPLLGKELRDETVELNLCDGPVTQMCNAKFSWLVFFGSLQSASIDDYYHTLDYFIALMVFGRVVCTLAFMYSDALTRVG